MNNPMNEEKTMPSLQGAEPRQLAEAIAAVLDDKKARDISVIDVEDKTILAEYFVICTGNSSTQVRALAGEVEYKMDLCGVPPHHVEGRDNQAWIILDFGSVIVHVFSREAREFYNLDRLYKIERMTDSSEDEQ